MTLPVNLLLKGRLCLLVGAGHVAHRKLGNLLGHGARVMLVAPRIHPRIRDLEDGDRVTVREGRYDPDLLEEVKPFLVYAATDSDEENRRIAADAERLGILASSASSWQEGDFISPSVIPWGKGQVSVTTEGASCRQAKFMRLRLSELLGGERQLLLFGVDTRSLSLEEFERVRPDRTREETLVSMLRHLAALEEFALLATCNRLELYAWTRPEEGLLKAVVRILGLEPFEDRGYLITGEEVVEHAANVVSGHLSQVIGETQITGQFKDAFRRAFASDVAGVHLQNLHDRALTLGRKIRALHGAGADGLPELVERVVRRRLPERGPRVLVLGAGAMGREVASRLAGIPGLRLTWANRTLDRMPDEPPCPRLPLSDALGSLSGFDQVVSVLGAARPVIREEHLERMEEPPLLLDLGLPRNVDPVLAGKAEVMDLGHFRRLDVDREDLIALARTVTAGSGRSHG
jgi:glutamyl-tRNA reductase